MNNTVFLKRLGLHKTLPHIPYIREIYAQRNQYRIERDLARAQCAVLEWARHFALATNSEHALTNLLTRAADKKQAGQDALCNLIALKRMA